MHDQFFRIALPNFRHSAIPFATFPAGIAHKKLFSFLLAGQQNLLGIDYDHKITRVEMRGKHWLIFAPEDIGNLDSQTAQNSTFGIDYMPFSVVLAYFR